MIFIECFFFFSSRRRHTRWNCDWSSDVCSSDLATGQEKTSGAVGDGLRRGRCKAPGCGVTHVLAPPQVLFRRLDETCVIGEVLAARAGGRGYRAIAGLLGRAAAGTVGL